MAAAQAFAGRHQVVDGAGQDRRADQFVRCRIPFQPALQWAIGQCALIVDMQVVGQQRLGRLTAALRGRAGLRRLEQLAHSRTANHHRQIVLTQPEALAVYLPGLQGQGAQAEGDAETRAALRVGQSVQDATIGQCLAAAG